MSGLMLILRTLGDPDIAGIRRMGLNTVKEAVAGKLREQRERLVLEAASRLDKDGNFAALSDSDTEFTDKDGVEMSGKQWFVHQALFAIPRVIMSGDMADIIRDDHFAAWGMKDAHSILANEKDPIRAVGKIFDRLVEQFS